MFKFSLVELISKIKRNNTQEGEELPKNIKFSKGSLYDAIYESYVKYPYNVAIQYYDVKITYKDLIQKINKCAKALKAIGIKENDIVSICTPNTPEEVYMFYAINCIGAISNMIHPLSSEKEMENYLNISESKVILIIDIVFPKLQNIIKNTKVETVIVTSATRSMKYLTRFIYWLFKGRKIKIIKDNKVLLWDNFIHKSILYSNCYYKHKNPKDTAVILYSGGTTGTPKGVQISNINFNAGALQSRYVSEVIVPNNSFLTFLPNFHAFGLGICTHTPLYNGMKIILIPKFNSRHLKKYIKKYKPNILCGVPKLYDSLIKTKLRKRDLKCLKLVVCGGDIMPLNLKIKVNNFLKEHGCTNEIRIGYGLTESAGVVSLSPKNILDNSDIIGYPFPKIKFKIVEIGTNKSVPNNKEGEICISGPNIMNGYLKNKDETENVLIRHNDGNIYLHTKDIGFIDNQGLIHYTSRLKRIIITSGYNVYPSHIENVLMNFENINEAVVIGVYHKSKGEVPKAFISLKNNNDKTVLFKAKLKEYLKTYLAVYEMPKEIIFIDKIPRTKLGKIDYKSLK